MCGGAVGGWGGGVVGNRTQHMARAHTQPGETELAAQELGRRTATAGRGITPDHRPRMLRTLMLPNTTRAFRLNCSSHTSTPSLTFTPQDTSTPGRTTSVTSGLSNTQEAPGHVCAHGKGGEVHPRTARSIHAVTHADAARGGGGRAVRSQVVSRAALPFLGATRRHHPGPDTLVHTTTPPQHKCAAQRTVYHMREAHWGVVCGRPRVHVQSTTAREHTGQSCRHSPHGRLTTRPPPRPACSRARHYHPRLP